jgi:hypothetical protein
MSNQPFYEGSPGYVTDQNWAPASKKVDLISKDDRPLFHAAQIDCKVLFSRLTR